MCRPSRSIGTSRNHCGSRRAKRSWPACAARDNMRLRFLPAIAGLAVALIAPSSAQFAPLKPPDVKFVPPPDSVLDAMLKLARVTAADVVYDLGSGDGRIPINAANQYGARGVGIEIDPIRIREANDNLKK